MACEFNGAFQRAFQKETCCSTHLADFQEVTASSIAGLILRCPSFPGLRQLGHPCLSLIVFLIHCSRVNAIFEQKLQEIYQGTETMTTWESDRSFKELSADIASKGAVKLAKTWCFYLRWKVRWIWNVGC
jgi:hypothetical protein